MKKLFLVLLSSLAIGQLTHTAANDDILKNLAKKQELSERYAKLFEKYKELGKVHDQIQQEHLKALTANTANLNNFQLPNTLEPDDKKFEDSMTALRNHMALNAQRRAEIELKYENALNKNTQNMNKINEKMKILMNQINKIVI